MQNDKTTLKDLSIFTSDGSEGVFALLDYTTTQEGKDMLRKHIYHPPDTLGQLKDVQDAIKFWSTHPDLWPKIISNGTLVMLDKFFESADNVPTPPTGFALLLNSFLQRVLNKQEYFLTKFSLSHLSDFLNGCTQLAKISEQEQVPTLLQRELNAIKDELKHNLANEIIGLTKDTKYTTLARLNYCARREMKNMCGG